MKEADTADIKSNKKKSSWELINILEEETYLENIGKIIERDFYPDLEKLRAQTDYLDAVEKNDVQKLREIYAKYSGKHPQSSRTTYDASPATFETPAERPAEEDVILTQNENDNSSGKSIQEDEGCKNIKLGLDQYLRTHTSEDNNSFQEMIQEAEAKNKHKYSWLYEAEEQSNSKIKELLSVPSIEEQAAGLERPLNVDTWNYKNKNYIMYVPDGKELTAAEKVELARGRQEIAHSNTSLLLKMDSGDTETNISDLLKEDGTNKKAIFCIHCPSLILNAGDGVYINTEFTLPHMMRPKSVETVLEEKVSDYWKVNDMYTFQNVGFSKNVGANKFLTCAECDMGPIGWFDSSTKECFVALSRVKHEDKS
ncbi:ess-2 splicing factor homolog isoform X2 [Lycorma delicatula]|uniref:ess-2 splicing factor homolog isoform X2 n=1 Tax=Lycorma delicatula TaxID=130591 RepID=UPI003F514645